jgi:serine/threonine protein kinase
MGNSSSVDGQSLVLGNRKFIVGRRLGSGAFGRVHAMYYESDIVVTQQASLASSQSSSSSSLLSQSAGPSSHASQSSSSASSGALVSSSSPMSTSLTSLRSKSPPKSKRKETKRDADSEPVVFAVKFLAKRRVLDSGRNGAEAALRERTILSALLNPFIVNIHAATQDSRNLWLVADLMPGGTLLQYHLRETSKRGGTLLSEEIVKFHTACLLLGLRYLRASGVIHRDVKLDSMFFILFFSQKEIMRAHTKN